MLLIDEVLRQDGETIVCRKRFRADEFFFSGHYPDKPLVPGVILCECAMQAGAILLAEHLKSADDQSVPVAVRLNDVRFKKMVLPGETLELEVTLGERMADVFFLSAKGSCGGKTVLRCEFACKLATFPPQAGIV